MDYPEPKNEEEFAGLPSPTQRDEQAFVEAKTRRAEFLRQHIHGAPLDPLVEEYVLSVSPDIKTAEGKHYYDGLAFACRNDLSLARLIHERDQMEAAFADHEADLKSNDDYIDNGLDIEKRNLMLDGLVD